jgi:hypothetical protein
MCLLWLLKEQQISWALDIDNSIRGFRNHQFSIRPWSCKPRCFQESNPAVAEWLVTSVRKSHIWGIENNLFIIASALLSAYIEWAQVSFFRNIRRLKWIFTLEWAKWNLCTYRSTLYPIAILHQTADFNLLGSLSCHIYIPIHLVSKSNSGLYVYSLNLQPRLAVAICKPPTVLCLWNTKSDVSNQPTRDMDFCLIVRGQRTSAVTILYLCKQSGQSSRSLLRGFNLHTEARWNRSGRRREEEKYKKTVRMLN